MADEVIQEFLLETRENLDLLDNELVRLEEVGPERELLDGIFRSVHTIKGTCGFLELSKMEKVGHVGEGLLSKLRDGLLPVEKPIIDALLAMGDALREMLDAVEATDTDGDGDYTDLVARLAALRDGASPAEAEPEPAPASEPVTAPPKPVSEPSVLSEGDAEGRGVAMLFGPPNPAPAAPAGEVVPASPSTPAPVSPPPAAAVPAPTVSAAPPATKAPRAAPKAAPAETVVKAENVRVDVSLLDKLMNLVGELVLARNQVLQHVEESSRDTDFVATSQRLNLITAELQEGVMKTRMQPINNIWGKFPRMVRHLASVCGKSVRMEMEGQDTELDRTILEAIKDPLTHIIRNSVDHGIEQSEARVAAGKPREGRLFLRAFHESGQVNMEIIDDGKGIDVEAVMSKALERGLVTEVDVDRMSDRDIMQLVFHPGFSTAKTVTNVSGRGVGMDVVKTNIERIGGTVEIQSEAGVGTTLRIKIPLTLAIIPTLVVQSAGERFAVPQVSLIELVRLDGAAALQKIEHIHGAPVYRLRGQLLPLVYLNDVLDMDGATSQSSVLDAAAAGVGATVNIVVLQAYDRQFGLVVDAIQDTAEIVVKPLGSLLKSLDVFAGATILGDGRVALIIDVLGVAQASSVLSDHRANPPVQVSSTNRATDDVQVLLFRSGSRRLAVPLDEVTRLEELEPERIEGTGDNEVVQYRGGILPLVRMCDVVGEESVKRDEGEEVLHVIVYASPAGSMGVIVDEIQDVLEERLSVHRLRHSRHGVVGSAIIGGRVTDVVDLGELLRVAELAMEPPQAASA